MPRGNSVRLLVLVIILIAYMAIPDMSFGRSAFSPRHTGMEPPGGPRNLDMGGRPIMRTPMGGMGYTDAYGNTLDDYVPEEKKPAKRRPEKKAPPRPLPNPDSSKPLWTY